LLLDDSGPPGNWDAELITSRLFALSADAADPIQLARFGTGLPGWELVGD
jgi:hypothetical protein